MTRLANVSAAYMRRERGRLARLDGRRGEWLCAFMLMAKGYRLLGFRLRSAQAEIDILAVRGRTVAVVEVKRRAGLAEALDAVTARQRKRLRAAARSLVARRPDLADAAVRLDLMALAPGRWPRHIRDAWPEN